MATKKKAKKSTTGSQLKMKFKKPLTAKQKSALAKGQNLMEKAQKAQKAGGTKTKTIVSAGKRQTIEVYKVSLNDALQKVSK